MSTILYINPLTPEIQFLIFDSDLSITKTLAKNLNTASAFPKILVEIVTQYRITDIWCVTGPGPFTLMRVITLGINAVAYTKNITIKSCHFFDLIGNDRHPIIEANAGEYLIYEGGEVVSIAKGDLMPGVYEGIFSSIDSTVGEKSIQYTDNQSNIIRVFSLKNPEIRISPIYFKPPHITGPKQ